MAQQPAVIIVARHGVRLDASDQNWHLSTPTPYDPPLTYGGWNQCRALGTRIADLLHAREEQALNASGKENNVTSRDFAQLNGGDGEKSSSEAEERPVKRRRIKHKVVIHSSPFLRCLQTSVAIAAGMAQYKPSIESGEMGKRPQSKGHTSSPRVRPAEDGYGFPTVPHASDSKHDLHHAIARKALHEHKRFRRSKLRVDAFLGEWLSPSYYEGIMPPPPSAMMVATAKAELMENETVEIFAPAAPSTKSSTSSLWGGANGSNVSLDDLSPVSSNNSPPPSPSRSRASTVESGRRSPVPAQPLISTLPKQEMAIYHPPQPHYAVSSSSQIPKGYVAHARTACVDIDLPWDSSRSPQDWGDGGEFGEEWSALHKRVRRGLNGMIRWYSQPRLYAKGEDALSIDQPDHSAGYADADHEEEQEDLVVILVTHGAGCNALIGALTGQPALLDVGMASLTMAVRRDDAPPLTVLASEYESSGPGTFKQTGNPDVNVNSGKMRRGSLDMGLSSVYEMKIVASNEHLRQRSAASPSMRPLDSSTARPYRAGYGGTLDPPRSNTSSALGSIRRPSALNIAASNDRSSSMPPGDRLQPPQASTGLWTPPSTGLWTPPAGRTPVLEAQTSGQIVEERPGVFSMLNERQAATKEPAAEGVAPDTRDFASSASEDEKQGKESSASTNGQMDGHTDEKSDKVGELPPSPTRGPQSANRKPSQSGLWGSKPSGETVVRRGRQEPKRRWTVDQD